MLDAGRAGEGKALAGHVGPKPLHWVGSTKKDLDAMPDDVKDVFGYALHLAQAGGRHAAAKPWKGSGLGVLEVVDDYQSDTYRAVYTVRFHGVVYVLHAFQKKSPTGIATSQRDVDLIATRLKAAETHWRKTYGGH